MRYFKLRVSKHPDVEANIAISDEHLDIYKKILRIKTDRGFGQSLKRLIKSDLDGGQNPYVMKAILEHNLQGVLASIASGYLGHLFSETSQDDISERVCPEIDSSKTCGEGQAEPENNVIQFRDIDNQ